MLDYIWICKEIVFNTAARLSAAGFGENRGQMRKNS